MLPTTLDMIRAALKCDPSLSPAERAEIIDRIKGRKAKPEKSVATPTEDRIVRRKEAAKRLGVSLRTLDLIAESGHLKRKKLPGRTRSVGFLESDLLALMRHEDDIKALAPTE